ncbi:unnamed protein product [Bursaphelenchus xylophilus]|nr:unnamed protein product [Bursaphelenchus xylophilus]CAG9084237.1 unnamed protein product [Bursaphelenchus xylophilus]
MEQCLTYPEMNGLDMELFAAKKKLFSWRLDDWEEEERQEDETFDYAKSIEQCQMNLRDAIRTSAQKSALMRYMKLKELRRETTVQGPVPPPRISVMGETSQPSKSPRPCSPVSVHPCHSWPPHPRFLPTTESAPAPCSCKVGKATRRPTNVTEQCPVTLKSRQSSMKAIRMGYDTFKLPQFEILKLMINNTNSHLPIHQSTYRKKQQQRRINLRRRNMPSFEFGVFHAEAKCNLTSGIKSHLSSSEPFRKTLNPKEFNSYITFLDSIPHRQCKLNSTLLQCERCWWTGFCPKIKKNCNLRRWQRLRKIDPKAFVEKDAELQAIFKKIGWASYLTKVKKTNERMCSLSTRRSSEMIHVEENRKRKKAPSSALLFKRENHRNKLREAPSISDWILTRSTHRALLRNRHLFNAAVTV